MHAVLAAIVAIVGVNATTAVGKRADLVLVAANPLVDLATLRRPAGVMIRGEWIPYERRRAVGGS